MARERVLYEAKYRQKAMRVQTAANPTLRHVTEGFVVRDCYIQSAGRVQCEDGVEREFQVLRIYFDDTKG